MTGSTRRRWSTRRLKPRTVDEPIVNLSTHAAREVTVKVLAAFVECHPRTIIRMIQNGRLRARRVGREWRIPIVYARGRTKENRSSAPVTDDPMRSGIDGEAKNYTPHDTQEIHERPGRGWLRNGNPVGDPRSSPRCGARTRKGTACQGPAVRGRRRCRMHGGVSTGPRTAEGRERIRRARTIHGRHSAAAKAERRRKALELAERRRACAIFNAAQAARWKAILKGFSI
jgi:excisionase family DNA binding protein